MTSKADTCGILLSHPDFLQDSSIAAKSFSKWILAETTSTFSKSCCQRCTDFKKHIYFLDLICILSHSVAGNNDYLCTFLISWAANPHDIQVGCSWRTLVEFCSPEAPAPYPAGQVMLQPLGLPTEWEISAAIYFLSAFKEEQTWALPPQDCSSTKEKTPASLEINVFIL